MQSSKINSKNTLESTNTDDIIDIIKSIFFKTPDSEDSKSILKHGDFENVELFEHPFKNCEKMNFNDDQPPEELIARVLQVGRESNDANNSKVSVATNNSIDLGPVNRNFCFLPLPYQMQSRLIDKFIKADLKVKELKPRASIDRKMSVVSLCNSLKRGTVSNMASSFGRKGRKSSSGSSIVMANKKIHKPSLQNSVAKEDYRISKTQETSESNLIQKRDEKGKRSKLKSSSKFIIQPTDFNLLASAEGVLNDEEYSMSEEILFNKDTDIEIRNKFAWYKKENARRKVSSWLIKHDKILSSG